MVTGAAPLASPSQAAILVAALALSPSFLAFLAVELIIQVTLSFLHFLVHCLLRLLLLYSTDSVELKHPFSWPSSLPSTTYTGLTTGAAFSNGLLQAFNHIVREHIHSPKKEYRSTINIANGKKN